MTTPPELQRLIQKSVGDPGQEPEFLRALLDARLYVHLPLSDDSAKLRLVCFTRPDGLTVIPVFSDQHKAEVAGQGAVRIGALRGRDLFAAAPGATFMLDPNDISTTLYPEEIRALMVDGTATVAPTKVQAGPVRMSAALPEDRWLGALLAEAVREIGAVQAIHLVQGHVAGCEEPTMLLGVLAVQPAYAERAARAVALALGASPRKPRMALDLTAYDPATPPEWVAESALVAIWRRRPAGAH